MGNTKQIQPVSIWTKNGNKNATILALVNFFDYHFDNGNGKVNYKLIGMESEVAVEYASENIEIPSSIIQQWGASDDIIWNYIVTTLGLILSLIHI